MADDSLQPILDRLEGVEARDYSDVFQYPADISTRKLRARYDRGDVVRALIDARPDATWAGQSTLLLDGEPSEELARIARTHRLWQAWFRADLMAEITGYSVILIPGANLHEPPTAEEARTNRLAVYGGDGIDWEDDQVGEDLRPLWYNLSASRDSQGRLVGKGRVHGSRCVHVADGRYSQSLLTGNPRLIAAYNRCLDFDKSVGGGAEGFFRSALPQYLLGYDPQKSKAESKTIAQQLWRFATGKLRALRTTAVKFERMAPTPVDFEKPGDFLLKVLAVTFRVPLTEVTNEALVAHSASTARRAWTERIDERRTDHAEPDIVAPSLVQFLSALNGAGGEWTPEDAARISVGWTDREQPTDAYLTAQTTAILASVREAVVDPGYALELLPEAWFGPVDDRIGADEGLPPASDFDPDGGGGEGEPEPEPEPGDGDGDDEPPGDGDPEGDGE